MHDGEALATESGLSAPHLKCMWTRLLNKHEDPRAARSKAH